MLNAEWTEDLAGLLASPKARTEWDQLSAGVPFRQTDWLLAWWNNCAVDAVARVVAVRDESQNLVAALPLYQNSDDRNRQVLRNLADGKACSDHVSLMMSPTWHGDRLEPIHAVADLLIDSADDRKFGWHSIVIDGVIEGDVIMDDFADRIRQRTGIVHATSRMHAWFRPCAEDFEAYLQTFSRSSRGKQRRMLKSIDKWNDPNIEEPKDMEGVLGLLSELIDLHQVRWQAVGETGSFDEPCARAFMQDTVRRFAESNRVWIIGLREGERLASAAMSIIGEDNRAYCYCSATDMNADKLQAGKLLTLMMIEMAHERGLAGIDFLRGDEEYKSRLHAVPKKVMELRIASPSMRSRLRHTAWLTAFEAKQLVRRSLGRKTIDVVSPA